MKIFIIVIIILIIVVLAFGLYLYLSIPDLKAKVTVVEIYSHNLNEKIFIKDKRWGLGSGHQVIVVSKSSEENFEPDEELEYVFKGMSPFFYDFENDTLNLYVGQKSKIPTEMSTNIKINQVVLTNPEMMELMDNYKEKGFKEIE